MPNGYANAERIAQGYFLSMTRHAWVSEVFTSLRRRGVAFLASAAVGLQEQVKCPPLPQAVVGNEGVESEHIEPPGIRPAGVFLKECVRPLPNTGPWLLGPCPARLPIRRAPGGSFPP